jgi:D-sedoheptulose 7-phosphate isomerase
MAIAQGSDKAALPGSAENIAAESLEESIRVKQLVRQRLIPKICQAAELIISSFRSGGKLLLVGNGGSAADAQHIAAEFVGRFEREREGWPAICLSTDTSVLTAIGNDYSVEQMFARQVAALGRPGDVLLAYSTSGRSPNVLRAADAARLQRMQVIGFCGESGGELAARCDVAICVPSTRTARIQESHITISHAICEIVENAVELWEPEARSSV